MLRRHKGNRGDYNNYHRHTIDPSWSTFRFEDGTALRLRSNFHNSYVDVLSFVNTLEVK
jgi:hypothetical protein